MSDKLTILQDAVTMRNKEIMEYQINIDNYQIAIQAIEDNPEADEDMLNFKEVLQKNLKDSLREQMKSRLIRDAMQKQLDEGTV